MISAPDTMLVLALKFGGLLALFYAVTVSLYFAMGHGLTWLNARNPGRRIQQVPADGGRRAAEVRRSLVSILVTTTSLTTGVFAQWHGWTLVAPLDLTWWNAVPLFVACMVLFEVWFYTAHRLMHTRALQRFHKLHHRSLTPTPWSNDSIGIVDTALHQSFYAIVPFFLPFPPLVLIAHRLCDHVNGTLGHNGVEYFAAPGARWPSPMLCTTWHDLHHSAFDYNFSNWFSWLDRACGTVHPEYDRMVAEAERRLPPVQWQPPQKVPDGG